MSDVYSTMESLAERPEPNAEGGAGLGSASTEADSRWRSDGGSAAPGRPDWSQTMEESSFKTFRWRRSTGAGPDRRRRWSPSSTISRPTWSPPPAPIGAVWPSTTSVLAVGWARSTTPAPPLGPANPGVTAPPGGVTTDVDVQAMLTANVAAANIPAPNANTLYLVFLPPGDPYNFTNSTGTITAAASYSGAGVPQLLAWHTSSARRPAPTP